MDYGEINFKADRWHIKCEPQVAARIKRVFPKVSKQQQGVISISNNPENCRELEWFLQRFPMKVRAPEDLARGAAAHRDMEYRLAELLERRLPPLDVKLSGEPRAYQTESAQMLEIKSGLLNADDVGLGKTVTALVSCALPENLPAVIVCPPHMAAHWRKFTKQWLPRLDVHVIRHGRPYPLLKKRLQADLIPDRLPDVIIVSYHRLRGWAETLAEVARTVIFDECQQLRRNDTQIYIACQHLAAKMRRRLGLSATPIFNYGSEFYWVINVLQPLALGTRQEFVTEWCKGEGSDKAKIADPELFGSYLRREGIMIRRTRAQVGRELAAFTKIVHEIDTDADVLKNLTSDAIRLAQVILASNEQYRGEKMHAAGEFDNLMRQATGIAKAPYVAQFVRMLLESGERVVLFGWHRAVYSIWLEHLKDFGPVLYTGSESPTQKEAAVERFTKGGSRLFIMSLRSGAGVDGLQFCCRTVVFGELDWSPGVHEQCAGRVYRDGQPDPVVAYFMLSEEGADPIMSDVLGIKREQIEGVRNPGAVLVERVDTGENTIKALARTFLDRRGITIEQPTSTTQEQPA